MTNMNQYQNIPAEKFQFAKRTDLGHDKKFDTKPVSYFQGAFRRFSKNKGAVVAAIVIAFLILFAIFAPFFTNYTPDMYDVTYIYAAPKLPICEKYGIPFWDGSRDRTNVGYMTYLKDMAIMQETGREVIKGGKDNVKISEDGKSYTYRYDTYYGIGFIYDEIPMSKYLDIQRYQNETGRQVLYPVVALEDRPTHSKNNTDANIFYQVKDKKATKITPVLDEEGKLIPNYWEIPEGIDPKSWGGVAYDSLRIEGEDGFTKTVKVRDENDNLVDEERTYYYIYGVQMASTVQVRVEYYEYYAYEHLVEEGDGVSEPLFLFGATETGKDIFSCLAYGARFSFIFASIVAIVNFIVGVIWGSISGYYGGKLDLAMERFCEILGSVPSMIIITLLKYHMGHFIVEQGLYKLVDIQSALVLFIAFFATGWIGMAGRTRMQFYRFKNQEYVLAARTLGASDARIMFKHIFPNGLGTIVTSIALVIPSMIYSETSLSYLGIINLEAGKLTSVGTLINAGQKALQQGEPYTAFVALFPCGFLVLLMLSFNLFGNGLRDAFNPSLRGSEE
ncbi:MAG: ABC transporter permease [Ruminococcaceae bacterium]|nr:ABC transporter permease [Oscillospiraceae bacterium]